jgi:hypothetical protein
MNKLYLSWLTQHLDTNKTNRELVNIAEKVNSGKKSEAKGKKPEPKKVKAEKQTDDPFLLGSNDGEEQEPKEPKPNKKSEAATKRNVDDRIEAEKNKESGTNPEDLAAALHGIRHASELEQAIGSPDSVFRSQEREPSKGTGAQYRKTESPEDVMARMVREGFFGNMAAGAGNLAGKAAGGIAKAGAGAVNMADKGIVGAGKLAGQAGGAFKTGMGSSLGTAADKIKSGPIAQKLGNVGGAIKGKVGGAIKVVGGLTKQVSSNPTVRGLASKGVDAIKAKLNDTGSKQTGIPVPPDGGAKPVAAGAKPAAGGESAPAGGNSSSNTNTVGRDQTNSNNTTTNNYGGGGAAGGKAAPQQQASELGTASGDSVIRGGAREASAGRVPAITGRPRMSMNEETKPQSNLSRIMEMRNRLSAKYGD